MKKPEAPLSDAALRDLRRSVQTLVDGGSLPAPALVAAAEALGGGLTIDLEAARSLGQPLVVLRVPSPAPSAALGALSPREREVAALVAQGLRNRVIARKLGITEGTVKDHVHAILEKADLPNRAALAAAWSGQPRA